MVEEFDSTGNLIRAGVYRAGMKDGRWRFFGSVSLRAHTVRNAAPGTLLAEGDFFGGAMNGWWRLFNKAGILQQEGQFVNDLPTGHQRLYVDGLLYEEGHMEQGRRTGTWTRYDELGDVQALYEW